MSEEKVTKPIQYGRETLPQQYRPLGAWRYFWLDVLYCLPIVGFVFLIIHSISKGNYNRRSFARSHFCSLLIGLILTGAIVAIVLATGGVEALEELAAALPY